MGAKRHATVWNVRSVCCLDRWHSSPMPLSKASPRLRMPLLTSTRAVRTRTAKTRDLREKTRTERATTVRAKTQVVTARTTAVPLRGRVPHSSGPVLGTGGQTPALANRSHPPPTRGTGGRMCVRKAAPSLARRSTGGVMCLCMKREMNEPQSGNKSSVR